MARPGIYRNLLTGELISGDVDNPVFRARLLTRRLDQRYGYLYEFAADADAQYPPAPSDLARRQAEVVRVEAATGQPVSTTDFLADRTPLSDRARDLDDATARSLAPVTSPGVISPGHAGSPR